MVGGFSLRKLYADLVTARGDVVVCYLAWLDLAGLRTAYAAVEHYTPDGRRTVTLGHPPAAEPQRRPDGAVEYLVVTRDGRRFRLVHHHPAAPWAPGPPPVGPHVHWRVLVPCATATGGWDGDGVTLSGHGYCDRVELRRPPRWTGLARLQWGRVHLPGRTIVFNTVDRTDGQRWARLTEWPAGLGREAYTEGDAPAGELAVPAPGGAICLRPVRVLHDGNPLDRDRVPGPLQRWGSRIANGHAHETRWLSVASGADGATGTALHESVWFGRGARAPQPGGVPGSAVRRPLG